MSDRQGRRAEWCAASNEKLRKLWMDGVSAATIARELGVSRNSVLGKIHRIKRRDASVTPRRSGVDALVKPRKIAAGGGSRTFNFRSTRTLPIHAKPAAVPDDLPPVVATVNSILDLEPHHCRWPVGDPQEPTFGYCGAPKDPGQSYCPTCRERAYGRRADTVPANIRRLIKVDGQSLDDVAEFVGG